jgi:cadmium resistance protein CadD (predicted permease)
MGFDFREAVATACATFAFTNIDDIFVLVTFFAEATTSDTLTPWKVTLGQYLGFTVIMVISMIGFAVALVLPSEPIGFLGLLPMCLGLWNLFGLFIASEEEEEGDKPPTMLKGVRSILKVALVTLMNGGDNIGTYIPLFSQTKGAEIVVFVVVYYILLGVWCLVAWLIMRQRHVLALAQKYIEYLLPFLYMGLGVFIVVQSECYPWSIEHIDDDLPETQPGQTLMSTMTVLFLLLAMSAMIWYKLTKKASQRAADAENPPVEVGHVGGTTQTSTETTEITDRPVSK